MHLYLMQHGAAFSDQIDPGRALSPVGQDQVRRSSLAMKTMGLALDLILCGAKKRACQTARIVAEALGHPAHLVRETEAFRPMATAQEMFACLEDEARGRGSVLVAGHLPALSVLASALLSSAPVGLQFENGGLTRLDVARLAPHGAALVYHLPPALLHLLAGP